MLEAFANGYADVLTGIQENDLMLVDNWRTDKSQESLGVVHRLYIVASSGFYIFKINVFLQERFISLQFPPTQILWFQCSVKSHGHELTLHHRAHLYSTREAAHLLQIVDQTSIPPKKREMVRTLDIKNEEFRYELMSFNT